MKHYGDITKLHGWELPIVDVITGGNPACNQGGMIVLEGNGSRDSHRGDGYKESEISYSLNTVEQHAVCLSQQAIGEYKIGGVASSLKQRDYKDATDLVIQ